MNGASAVLSGAGKLSAQANRARPHGPIRPWVGALSILALAAVLFFPRLGERALSGPEGRWGEITREMQLSGNYFWPTINGQPYYGKPLLSYWLVAGASYLTGGVNESAARLPSAVSGLLGVALLMLMARRLYGDRSAILAGFILATSYSYVSFARLASADMETGVGVLAALAIFVCHGEKQQGWGVLGFWLIMAVTSLVKGLEGFALPLLVIGSYLFIVRGRRGSPRLGWHGESEKGHKGPMAKSRWLFSRKTIPAAAAAALLYFLPFAISYAMMHSNAGLDRVLHENVIRFVAPFDHEGPAYLYLYAIFVLMAPWSVFLPAALVQMHSKVKGQGDRFTLAYFWATFLFFTLSGSRRDYYLLPILPAAAIVVARLLATEREALDPRARRLMDLGYLAMVVLTVTFGVLVLLPPTMRPGALSRFSAMPEPVVFVQFWGLMLASIVFALRRWRPKGMALSTGAVAFLGLLFSFVFAFPGMGASRDEKAFAQAVRRELHGDTSHLVLYKIWGPGLLFYLSAENPIPVYSGAPALARRMKDSPDLWVISHGPDMDTVPLPCSVVMRSQGFRLDESPHLQNKYVLFRPAPAAERNKAPG